MIEYPAMIKPAARIAAIVLAAGGSARMGQPKQLLPIDDQPMVRRVVEQVLAAGLARSSWSSAPTPSWSSQPCPGLPADIVSNPDWAEGLSSSLRVGLQALEPDIQAAIMVLADQPALTSELFVALVNGYLASSAPIVVPVHQGMRGNPVLFDRALFPELLAVEGDKGGRAVIARHPEKVKELEVGLDAVIADVDTPEDYGALVRLPQSVQKPSDHGCGGSGGQGGSDGCGGGTR